MWFVIWLAGLLPACIFRPIGAEIWTVFVLFKNSDHQEQINHNKEIKIPIWKRKDIIELNKTSNLNEEDKIYFMQYSRRFWHKVEDGVYCYSEVPEENLEEYYKLFKRIYF